MRDMRVSKEDRRPAGKAEAPIIRLLTGLSHGSTAKVEKVYKVRRRRVAAGLLRIAAAFCVLVIGTFGAADYAHADKNGAAVVVILATAAIVALLIPGEGRQS